MSPDNNSLSLLLAVLFLLIVSSGPKAESNAGGKPDLTQLVHANVVATWAGLRRIRVRTYDDGTPGIDKNDTLERYKWAAKRGDAQSQYILGVLYQNGKGEGVPQDFTKAAALFRKAAERGYAKARINYGIAHIKGEGVARDAVLAHMWFSLTASQGNKNASEMRARTERRMPPASIAEAERLAREWTPKAKHHRLGNP